MTDLQQSESINLDGIHIEIRRSNRRKTLALEVGNKGVIARAPMRMRFKSIEQFILSKQNWIKHHLSNLNPPLPALELIDGAELLYRGRTYRLLVSLGARQKVSLNDHTMTINVPIKQSHLSVHDSVQTKLVKWYKKSALELLEQRVNYFSTIMDMGVSADVISKVRDYKRRWGSCDHKGQLSFNWRIIMAPPEILDYVVVHELAHRIEFNHSKRFWSIVEAIVPDRKDKQQWLNNNGAAFYRL